MRFVSEHANEVIRPEEYLSPAWHEYRRKTVSASEIAIILGLSPYGSPFDLWWLKRTGVDSQPENKEMRRGRRLEPLILEDFQEEHPEFNVVTPCGLVVNNDRPWQSCTPDGLASEWSHAVEELNPVAVVEAKTAGGSEGWGESGTDDIPVEYRAQVLWQMDTLALNVAYVPMWLGTVYREYVVEYDEIDVKLMRDAAVEFLDSIAGDRQPDIDAHKATRRRLKKLHPDLVDDEVEIPATILRQHWRAKQLRDKAQDRMDLAENRIRGLLGPAARGTVAGRKAVSRSIYEVKEHVRRTSTTDRLNFPRKEL